MQLPRSSGVLLHPTSLPGGEGIGDLGPEAFAFVDFLAATGQTWWQVLPLGPAGGLNSPYQSNSSCAGNPLLISLADMVDRGWLGRGELRGRPSVPSNRVEFTRIARYKQGLLRRAFEAFPAEDPGFRDFRAQAAGWLDDFAFFAAIKENCGGKGWWEWDQGLSTRQTAGLKRAREQLALDVRYQQFVQYAFEVQMQALRRHCVERGVRLIGDIPIFVALDSADVWARPELFLLDASGRPTVQAGVPPDLFSEDGQLWGNPLYRWKIHEQEGFSWWIGRVESLLRWVDLIRIDHFRGFEACWEVPGRDRTARNGRWVPSPGDAFFKAVKGRLGRLPFIAEDLGLITPAVEALRDRFKLPGMRVLQFGFSGSPGEDKYLPHRFIPNCVAYTGTHDNDTTLGWLRSTDVQTTQSVQQVRSEREFALKYVGSPGKEFHWDLIRLLLRSVADVAIVPMQDILGLDSSARMNVPGKAAGNWGWRFSPEQLTERTKARLAEMTALYGRWRGKEPKDHAIGATPTSEASLPEANSPGPSRASRSRGFKKDSPTTAEPPRRKPG